MQTDNKYTEKARVLVEFYDREYMENIVSLLHGTYSAVVYVCFSGDNVPTARDRAALSRFVRNRFGFDPRFLEIEENTLPGALGKLRSLISDGRFYDFDITGGSSIFIAAAGALMVEAGTERMCIHEYDVTDGTCKVCCPKDRRSAAEGAEFDALTISEILDLQGIKIVDTKSPIRYEMTRELSDEILRLWEAVSGNLKEWNAFAVLPAEYTKTLSGVIVEKRMAEQQYAYFEPLLKRLAQSGILSNLRFRSDGKHAFVTFCLNVPECAYVLYQKGGNLLEMLVYLTVVNNGCFGDCCIGIKLDWDDRTVNGYANPFNEIDVVMTKGHIPYFVSCKNTKVEKDFLYEIMIMTKHFGGAYAVPVLLSTVENSNALRARAAEMGIVLIDHISTMTAQEFAKKLDKEFCGAGHT